MAWMVLSGHWFIRLVFNCFRKSFVTDIACTPTLPASRRPADIAALFVSFQQKRSERPRQACRQPCVPGFEALAARPLAVGVAVEVPKLGQPLKNRSHVL